MTHGEEPDSRTLHLGPDGEWTFERLLLHAAIIDDLLEGHPSKGIPRVVFTAGGPASGKSTVVDQFGLAANAVLIDVDRIRLLLPEYDDWQKEDPESAADRTHREASEVARKVAAAALQTGRNVVYDGVGGDDDGKFSERIAATLGITKLVQLVYATVSVEIALEREQARFAQTGRRVPEAVVRAGHRAASRGIKTVAQLPVFRIEIYDTTDPQPRLLAHGPGGQGLNGLAVVCQAGYAAFLGKGDV